MVAPSHHAHAHIANNPSCQRHSWLCDLFLFFFILRIKPFISVRRHCIYRTGRVCAVHSHNQPICDLIVFFCVDVDNNAICVGLVSKMCACVCVCGLDVTNHWAWRLWKPCYLYKVYGVARQDFG